MQKESLCVDRHPAWHDEELSEKAAFIFPRKLICLIVMPSFLKTSTSRRQTEWTKYRFMEF